MNTLHRAMWAGFRKLGLDARLRFEEDAPAACSSLAGAEACGPADAGASWPSGCRCRGCCAARAAAAEAEASAAASPAQAVGLLPPKEDARMARYLCSAAEVQARQQQFEAVGELSQLTKKGSRRRRDKESRSGRSGRSGRSARARAGTAAAIAALVPQSTARQRRPAGAPAAAGAAAVAAEAAGAAAPEPAGPEPGEGAAGAASLRFPAPQLDPHAQLGPEALEVEPTPGPAALIISMAATVVVAPAGTAADGPSQLDLSPARGTGTQVAAAAMVQLPAAWQQAAAGSERPGASSQAAPAADGVSQLEVLSTLDAAGAAPGAAAAREQAGRWRLGAGQQPQRQQQEQHPGPAALQRASLQAGGAEPDLFDAILQSQGSQLPGTHVVDAPAAMAAAAADDNQSPVGKGWLASGWGGACKQQQAGSAPAAAPKLAAQPAAGVAASTEQAAVPQSPAAGPALAIDVEATPSGMHPPSVSLTLLDNNSPTQQGQGAQQAQQATAGAPGHQEQQGVPETPSAEQLPPSPDLGSAPQGSPVAGDVQQQQQQRLQEATQQQQSVVQLASAAAGDVDSSPAAASLLVGQGTQLPTSPGGDGPPAGTQEVENALQIVGVLSSHFAATQEQADGPADLADQASRGAAPAAGPPQAQLQAQPSPEGKATVAGGTDGGEVTSPTKRRWRRQQQQHLGFSDSEGEEERRGAAAGALRRKHAQHDGEANAAEEEGQAANEKRARRT